MAPFVFNPPDGYRNKVSFPTTPASEDDFRNAMQSLLDQMRDELNSGASSAIGIQSLSRQAIINGNFDVWQRGTSFTNPTNIYTADRFATSQANTGVLPTSIIHQRLSLNPGDIQGASYGYRIALNGAGSGLGASDQYSLRHKIENGTRYLCGNGKKITLSFWAKSDIPGKRIGVFAQQLYGSGGAPSAGENIPGQAFTLSAAWTKYSLTLNANTLVGKTFGTNNDDAINLIFTLMWGSTYGSSFFGANTAETFGGAGNIDIAQVQVNAGDAALPFQPRSYAEELALCRRYCYALADETNVELLIGNGYAATGAIALIAVPFQVEMRMQPTLVATASDWKLIDGITSTDLSALSIQPGQNGKNGLVLRAQVAAGLTAFRPYSLCADNTPGRRMIFDAEL